MTSEEDIGFAIHFDKTAKANNLIEMETVFPYIRLECSQVPISGSILCEKAGRCKPIPVCCRFSASSKKQTLKWREMLVLNEVKKKMPYHKKIQKMQNMSNCSVCKIRFCQNRGGRAVRNIAMIYICS